MDVWIRTQNKMRLVKPVDFYLEEIINYINNLNEVDIYALNLVNANIRIGTYKTKERALEVLDEIQDLMTTDAQHYMGPKEVSYQTCACYKSDILMIYEMPID